MTLSELIAGLEDLPQNKKVPFGFYHPHSHRGDYAQLAFEPAKDVLVSDMLRVAKECIGKTFPGYKGGDYEMGENTEVFIAQYGQSGDGISYMLIDYMDYTTYD